MLAPQNLGLAKNADVLSRFLDLNGKRVIDAGCGAMEFSRSLADLGASVLAIDPDPQQSKINAAAELPPGLEFRSAGAEALPAEDASMDGVFFAYSLHHVPAETYPRVFAEIERVLKPGGFLYVIEPTACPLNDVMKLFHNEDVVRQLAQKALVELAEPLFETADVLDYHSLRKFDAYEDFANAYSRKTYNPAYTAADVRQPAVREAFERAGQPDYNFQNPKRAVCLQGKRSRDA